VEIEQIRLERIALPEENVKAVFEQMRAERRQYAARFRAEGEREASRIRSEAELEAARIRAEGAEQEARIRGQSAAEVAKIYADAHRVDPQLYRFTRSLDSLDQLVTDKATLILRTDAEPFSLLQSQESK
jgi:membrane protease subunit HflC